MMTLLIHLLHIFIITIFTLFMVSAFLAINGTFDNWTTRFKVKKNRPVKARFIKKPYVQ